MAKSKTKEVIPPYIKPPLQWVVFKRSFKLLAPIPYKYNIPDLKLLNPKPHGKV